MPIDTTHLRERESATRDLKGRVVSTVTINTTPAMSVTTSTDQPQAQTAWKADWILEQEVVVFGSPADAGEGGRLAVREHAGALRRLRDN